MILTLAAKQPDCADGNRRLRLEQRIHRRYQTVTQPVQLGSLFLSFTRIADPDSVLDDIVAEMDRSQKRSGKAVVNPPLPYWAQLWDSATALAAVVMQLPEASSLRVLDLGCGMGLAGTAAAVRGARVLFADLEAPALLFAALNTLPFSNRIRTRRLDWRTDRLGEKFDVILGADILYEREQWDFLVDFWEAHLAEDGCVLLGEPGRQSGELFVSWIQQRGWMLEESVYAAPLAKAIKIFRLERSR